MDLSLKAEAQETLWRSQWTKVTNFARDYMTHQFNTNVQHGSTAQCTINKSGDLLASMYIIYDICGLSAREIGETQAAFPTYKAKGADQSVFANQLQSEECREIADAHSNVNVAQRAMAAIGRKRFLEQNNVNAQTMGDEGEEEEIDLRSVQTSVSAVRLRGQVPENASPSVWAHWSNAIGYVLTKHAALTCGGQLACEVSSDVLYAVEDLCARPGKPQDSMVGKRYNRRALIRDSQSHRRLYVPMPFWFSQDTGSALPIAAMQFHSVQLNVVFEELGKCIVTSEPTDPRNSVGVFKAGSQNERIAAHDLSARVLTGMVYVEQRERDLFIERPFDQLISQFQVYRQTTTSPDVKMTLPFNHPCTEMFWFIRRKHHEATNNHFNFSGIDGMDPLLHGTLKLNNQPCRTGDAKFFRELQPFEVHTQIPNSHLYNIAFATNPERTSEPSGSLNFSRIDQASLELSLQPELVANGESVQVVVIARNHNLMNYDKGMAGIAYSS
jgi:hypothetical protein